MRSLRNLVFTGALLFVVALYAFPAFRRWLAGLLPSLGEIGDALLAALGSIGLHLGLGGGSGMGAPGSDQGTLFGKEQFAGGLGKPGSTPAAPGTGGGKRVDNRYSCSARGGADWQIVDLGPAASPRYKWVRPGTYTGPGTLMEHFTCADGWDTTRQQYNGNSRVADPCAARGSWATEWLGGTRYRCGDGSIVG